MGGQDWIALMILNILRIRSGSDSIFSDQDWTWTEKVRSYLIYTVTIFTLGDSTKIRDIK